MGDVVIGHFVTTLDIPPVRVLTEAINADLDCAVIVGFDKEGKLYFASSKADGGTVLWLFAQAQRALLKIGDPE